MSKWSSVLILLLCVPALQSCCKRAVVKVTTDRTECLTAEPPRALPIDLADCPEGLAVCLDAANGAKLNTYIVKVQRYMSDAYLACGPVATEEESP